MTDPFLVLEREILLSKYKNYHYFFLFVLSSLVLVFITIFLQQLFGANLICDGIKFCNNLFYLLIFFAIIYSLIIMFLFNKVVEYESRLDQNMRKLCSESCQDGISEESRLYMSA